MNKINKSSKSNFSKLDSMDPLNLRSDFFFDSLENNIHNKIRYKNNDHEV